MLPNNGMTLIITPPNLSIALISLSLIVIKALIIPTIATTLGRINVGNVAYVKIFQLLKSFHK